MNSDPRWFDHARDALVRARRLPPGPERTAALEAATRALLAFDRGDRALTNACIELGWRDEVVRALAGELVSAASSPRTDDLVAIGTRIHDLFAADEPRLRALVARTCDRLKAPSSVVRQAIVAAARAEPKELLAVDDALAMWLRAHAAPAGATLAKHLVDALAQLRESTAIAWFAKRVTFPDRGVLVERLARGLDALRATLPDHAASWIARVLVLLPNHDAIVGDVARGLTLLDPPTQRRIALELLAATLPDAVLSGDRLVVQRDGEPVTLWHDGATLQLIEGDPATSTSVRHSGASAHWTRHFAGLVVTVSFARSMGDAMYLVEVERLDKAKRVSFMDESPDTIAIHRSGAWVWHQTMSNGRTYKVHDLGGGTPPHAEKPPRDEVVLVTELIGEGCPTMFGAAKFLFAGETD